MIRNFRASAPLFLLLALCANTVYAQPVAPVKTQHVVMIVWDGLRPDSVNAQNTPTLFALAQNGVTFAHHHPVYPSSTEVNGTALATGMMPEHGGIVGNKEYRPDIDPLKAVALEDLDVVRKGDVNGSYLGAATVAEIVQGAGGRTAVAGTKPVSILADRAETRVSSAARNSTDIFEGQTAPAAALSAIVAERGEFPPTIEFPNTKQDTWTTAALTQDLWKTGVPRVFGVVAQRRGLQPARNRARRANGSRGAPKLRYPTCHRFGGARCQRRPRHDGGSGGFGSRILDDWSRR